MLLPAEVMYLSLKSYWAPFSNMDRCNANVSGKLDTKIEDNWQYFRNMGEGWKRE